MAKFRSFQYRVLQRALVTNIELKKWQIKESDLCTNCGEFRETISHLLVECEYSKELWDKVKELVENEYPG